MFKRFSLVLFIIILIVVCPCFTAAAQTYEQTFQQKANLIIDYLADNHHIPRRGDREKYLWPALIAYQVKYPQADWTAEEANLVAQFTRRNPDSFYTNQDAFSAPGITRLLYLGKDQARIQQTQRDYLNYLFDSRQDQKYSFWSSGGTENFVNMLRTSGYLLAELGIESNLNNARSRKQKKADWILKKAKKTYQVGTAEWDSSSYNPFNLIGWLNLYDFAEDSEIKLAAKAVLDYYASTIALKYTHGVHGGGEQRGGGALSSFNTYSDYLAWLWFSEYIPEDSKNFFSWPAYIQAIYAATSSYRPPIEAVELAQKQFDTTAYYQNYKANYALSKLNIPEFFYIGKTYTLGSVLAPLGEQLVNWKLVAYPTSEPHASVVTGGNLYYSGNFKGVGKTIFDRYIQHENILIQATYISDTVKKDYRKQQSSARLRNIISKIPCGKSCQFLLLNKLYSFISPVTYPLALEENKFKVSNYISYESDLETLSFKNIYFIRLPQTYLAVHALTSAKLYGSDRQRSYLVTQGGLDELVAIAIEVGDRTTHDSFENFQNAIIQNSKFYSDNLQPQKLIYRSSDGTKLTVNYEKIDLSSSIKSASLSGSEGITVQVNGREINFNQTNPALYKGKHLNIENGILSLQGKNSVYQVDYSGSVPQFSRN